METSRRDFIKMASGAAAGIFLGPYIANNNDSLVAVKNPVCTFTKSLQFLDYEKLGEALAKIGFTAADLSVRNGGHVFPKNVKTDLPKAIKALQRSGVSVPMMVSDIIDPDNPETEIVLGTAAESGIKYYRMGYLSYDKGISVMDNLDVHRKTFEKLEKMNRKFNIHGCYQNHSGTRIGGPVWDLYTLVKDLDPAFIGVQYDIRHAVVEGGVSWPLGMKLLSPWIKTCVMKDFIWKNVNDKWRIVNVPLGDGMVDFDAYFTEYKTLGISGPVDIHYEYDLGGAESGSRNPTMSLDKISDLMAIDLKWLKNKFYEHGISGAFE